MILACAYYIMHDMDASGIYALGDTLLCSCKSINGLDYGLAVYLI